MEKFFFLLVSLLLLISLPQQIIATLVLRVPGLRVGASILFSYSGKNFSVVTLSIEDSCGKGLHFANRHNAKCEGNPPDLLFNTRTNGKFDRAEIIKLSELSTSSYWNVTTEENNYLINQYGNESSYVFDYRSPHLLSDIKAIKLYPLEGCGVEDTKFKATMIYHQAVPLFTKLSIRGRKPAPGVAPFFALIVSSKCYCYVSIDVSIDATCKNMLFVGSTFNLPDKKLAIENEVTDETYLEMTIQKLDEDVYKVTGSVNGQTLEQTFPMDLTALNRGHARLEINFMDIEKLEIVNN